MDKNLEVIIRNKNVNSKDKEIRRFNSFEIRAKEEGENKELYVEGYAATFNDTTVLYEFDGIEYKEQIDDKAFESADMSDVILNYNHTGKVVARTRNNTLQISVDSKGLFIRARLDGTEEGRRLYEEIKGGYIDRMSFQFSVQEASYDTENYIRTIRKVKKLYDVSAVDIPAYDTTSIVARDLQAVAKEFEKEKERSLLRKKLEIMTYL